MTDFKIVYFLNQFGRGTIIDNFTIIFSSTYFLVLLWLVIAFAILFFDKKNGKVIFFSLIIAIAFHFILAEGLLKSKFFDFFELRQRPYLAYPDLISAVGQKFTDSSFPSSHMSSTLVFFSVIFWYYRKYWPGILLFILVMAFCRMHQGMHYPTDAIFGSILGIVCGVFGILIGGNILRKKYGQNIKQKSKTLLK